MHETILDDYGQSHDMGRCKLTLGHKMFIMCLKVTLHNGNIIINELTPASKQNNH